MTRQVCDNCGALIHIAQTGKSWALQLPKLKEPVYVGMRFAFFDPVASTTQEHICLDCFKTAVANLKA